MSGCVNTEGSYGTHVKSLVEPSDTTSPCDPATFSDSSERYELLNENLRYTDDPVTAAGLTGSIDYIANHMRAGARIVVGQIVMNVGPNELANWLPRILFNDGNVDGVTYTTVDNDNDKNPFDILLQRDQGLVQYRHCVVNRALLQGRASSQDDPDRQVLRLTLDVVGAEEHSGGSITWPDPEPGLPTGRRLYWLHGDGKLELDDAYSSGVTEELNFDAFNLIVNNNLDVKTRNHLTVTHMKTMGRQIRLQTPIPYTSDSHTNLYISRFDGTGRIELRGDKNLGGFTPESSWVTKFEFPRLFQRLVTPRTRGRGEIPLSLDLTAYRTASSEPITVTNQTS